MVGQTVALNVAQKTLPNISLIGNVNTVGVAGTVIYTVPAGKRAQILSCAFALVSTGTGTKAYISYGNIQGRYPQVIDANAVPVIDPVATNLLLTAGQKIQFIGDAAGNNESINYLISIQETAA